MKRLMVLFSIVLMCSCAMETSEDLRSADGSNDDSQSSLLGGGDQTVTPSKADVIKPPGKTIFIVCFYGDNDHDDVVKKECARKLRACKKRYGSKWCKVIRNPTDEDLKDIEDEGVVIVVTHSTPGQTTCETGVGVWDSDLTPTDLSECTTGPVIWFGCYGAQVSEQCENVIPLADTPEVLVGDEHTDCRFQATILCIEKLKPPYSQDDINRCVKTKMVQMCPKR